MEKKSKQSLGGAKMAIVQRENAIKKYYENPNICLFCNKIIEVSNNLKCSQVRKKKFCNKSCATKLNNSIYPKRIKVVRIPKIKIPKTKKEKPIKIKKILTKEEKLENKFNYLLNITKKELFDKSANWQAARSGIQHHARQLYDISNKPKCCLKCNYDKHYEVCHKKSVSSFEGNASIKFDINNI